MGRPKNYSNTREKEHAKKIIRAFYQREFGETVKRVNVQERAATLVQRKNCTSLIASCLATIKKADNKFYTIGFDVVLDAQGAGDVLELIEFFKSDGTVISLQNPGKRFKVTRHWKFQSGWLSPDSKRSASG